MGGIHDGRGVASHDHGADSDGGAGRLVDCMGGADGACSYDTYDGGSSANRDHADTSGGRDAHDGRIIA
jgi:hypothetical protein